MEKMFKAIENQCGRWKEVPKEVKIKDNGLTFSIPIWSESRTLVVAGEEEILSDKDRWPKNSTILKIIGSALIHRGTWVLMSIYLFK